MKKYRKLLSMVSFFLIVGVIISGKLTAFADSVSPSSSSATVTKETYGETGSAIDKLSKQLSELREQEKDLDKSMRAQHNLNSEAIKLINSQISPDDISKVKAVNVQNKAIRDTNKLLFDTWDQLNKAYQEAEKTKNVKLIVALKQKINAMRNNQMKPIWDQITSNNNSIKGIRDHINAQWKQIHLSLDPLRPLEKQTIILWSKIKSLEKEKGDAWGKYNFAVENRDLKSAEELLVRLISYKQQIINVKKQIYSIQLQIALLIEKGPKSPDAVHNR